MNAIKDYKIRIPQVISINWIGFYTLYKKEILRFLNVWIQTVFSPVVTLILFLAVFTIALGLNRNNILGHEYGVFILPGLICMQILQNAFANTSSSLMIAKVQGNIVDILYPPLSPMEVTAAMLLGAITRGLIIGFFSACCHTTDCLPSMTPALTSSPLCAGTVSYTHLTLPTICSV